MDAQTFVHVVKYLDRLWDNWPDLYLDSRKEISRNPEFPNSAVLGKLVCGPCRVNLIVNRKYDDVVPTLVLYDANEDEAPILYAVGSEIDDLWRDLIDASVMLQDRKAV